MQRAVPTRRGGSSVPAAAFCVLMMSVGLNRQLLGGRGLRPGASEQSDTYNGNGVISLIQQPQIQKGENVHEDTLIPDTALFIVYICTNREF